MGSRPVFYIAKKGASDKVYQLLAHGRWFSPSAPASSTTKTGRHDIPEILLRYTQLVHTLKQSYLVYQCPVILL
jgi:hypothetical protein